MNDVIESSQHSGGQPFGDSFSAIAESVSEADFLSFQRLIERQAGIHLAPVKKALLVGRLARRLRELRIPTLREYYKRVAADPAELTHMLDCISTNETHFFREPSHFDFLSGEVLPRWNTEAKAGERPKQVRVWSAGCSTGEEPYSIAMTLLDQFPSSSGWHLEILATDLSTRVLQKARDAQWPIQKAQEIPQGFLKSYMLRGTGAQEGKMKASSEIRQPVSFEYLNLLESSTYPNSKLFDLIFCRNVLIYFQPETKQQVIHRLLNHLAPDGYLFVGHSESLNHLTDAVRTVIPTVYTRARAEQR
jgi:chemotaxis protein methyltransferase CheR